MKVIIMCAGKGERWGQPTPKELAHIRRVPNLRHTMKFIPVKPIIIISEAKKEYFKRFETVIGSDVREIDRFRNAFPYLEDHTVILYGDCCYDPFDLEIIINATPEQNTFFGRKGQNVLTQKKWGEIFAVYVVDKEKFMRSVKIVAKLFDDGHIKREIGWEVFKVENGMDPAVQSIYKWDNFVELSDYTDDFDSLEEYNNVMKNYL